MKMRPKEEILKETKGNNQLGEDISLLLELLIDIRDELAKSNTRQQILFEQATNR